MPPNVRPIPSSPGAVVAVASAAGVGRTPEDAAAQAQNRAQALASASAVSYVGADKHWKPETLPIESDVLRSLLSDQRSVGKAIGRPAAPVEGSQRSQMTVAVPTQPAAP
jgi:hypothetical protein